MIKIFETEEMVLSAMGDLIVSKAHDAIMKHERFNIALSGGTSPKRLYELLASEACRNRIEWKKVFFFFGDERYVPLDHNNSNYLMAKKSLFEPLSISQDHIFAVNTTMPPGEAAHDYEIRMLNHFHDSPCSFDFILLGLGDNAHTASLFPFTKVLHEKNALVKEIFVDEVGMYRITFTAPLINAAQTVAFLVYGYSKAEAVHHILEGERNMEAYPAQLIIPSTGEIYWFLDQAAAGRLANK